MKIVSSFRDYYDGIALSDGDYNTIFLRGKTRFSDIKCNFAHIVPDSNNGQFGVLCFCGIFYPFYRWNISTIGKPKYKYIWGEKLLNYNWNKYLYQRVEQFVEHCKTLDKELANTIAPIFFYEYSNYPCGYVISPRLEGTGFESVLPPTEAYMLLYKFLCNQNRPERPIPEMPNDIKIEQHGFDLRQSFRKQKEGA